MKYINGSDMLLAILGKCVGHSTEHSVSYDTETKTRAVKAPEKAGPSVSLFKETTVSGLKITISFKGLEVYNEAELGVEALRAAWKRATPVTAECFARKEGGSQASDRTPYLKAQFIITKLSESFTADDDVSFDGELQMTGAPEIWTDTDLTLTAE